MQGGSRAIAPTHNLIMARGGVSEGDRQGAPDSFA